MLLMEYKYIHMRGEQGWGINWNSKGRRRAKGKKGAAPSVGANEDGGQE